MGFQHIDAVDHFDHIHNVDLDQHFTVPRQFVVGVFGGNLGGVVALFTVTAVDFLMTAAHHNFYRVGFAGIVALIGTRKAQ